MRTIYLYVEKKGLLRKVAIDMPYFATHKKLRLLKFYFEEGLYLLHLKDLNDTTSIEKYFLTKENIISEDTDHYFFKFPFKLEQILNVAV
jgi:hypothetical protein